MKIFIAGMDTETNTFSPIPTGYRSFADHIIMHGDTSAHPANCCSSQMIVWRRRAEERQWGVAESLCVTAEPGGITIGRVYEQFRDQIMADLKAAMPVDAVLLALHGAMVADGYEDCEGDMLRRVREIVGPEVPVGAELDLHCHTTEAMVANATALIAYKEYPHTDIADRAEELFTLIADAAMGQTRPAMAMFDCRMINTYRPTEQPMRGFVDKMIELEGKEGVLAVSLGHCFPWADVPDVGTRMIVVTDNDPQGASALAERLGRELFRMRHEIRAQVHEHRRDTRPGAGRARGAGGDRRRRRQCRRRRTRRFDLPAAPDPGAWHHRCREQLLLGSGGRPLLPRGRRGRAA